VNLKIKDLKPHMENVTLMAKVIQKSEPKFVGFDKKKYASAILEDETGKITLNLWRDQVDQVSTGDLVKVSNAFIHVRFNTLQVSTWSKVERVGP
jgi:ssDNA-binding replication factor A large subunit